MKKLISAFLTFSIAITAMAQIRVAAPDFEMILFAEEGDDLCINYFGSRLSDADFKNYESAGVPWQDAYPTYGIYTNADLHLCKFHMSGMHPAMEHQQTRSS